MSKTPQASKWYSIRQRTPVAAAAQGVQSAAEIRIYGDIGASWWEDTVTAADFVRDLSALTDAAINIRINSYGGSVTDGIAIYNAIKRHSAHITISIDAAAYSIASLIAMAGDTVEMAENAMLMIHAPWGGVAGNSAQLREYADMLDKWAEAMSTSYAAKSGQSASHVLALLTDGVDHYYTAAEAKAAGFVDSIVAANPESATAMASFDLTRYRTVPAPLAQCKGAAAAAQPVAQATPSQEPSMTQAVNQSAATATPATATTAADVAAIEAKARAEALAQDTARRASIAASFKPHASAAGVAELQRQCEADHTITAEAAGLKLLAHLGQGAVPVAGTVRVGDDGRERQRNDMTQAILARAAVVVGKEGRVQVTSANHYRGATLLDIAKACLERTGTSTAGMDKLAVVAAAFTQSTSDFPLLLENVMHKTLQGAYALSPDTWRKFCAVGTVSDFRAHSRYRVGSIGSLDAKNELGEYKMKAIPDGEKASITATTRGNLINISREAIINDDLGAFTGLAGQLGRAAARSIEELVYTTLALNSGMGPTLSDGITLFHASHNNLIASGSGSAPTVTGFDAMRVKLASQKDVSGNDYLDLLPAVWLGPIGLGGAARVVVNSEYDPDTNSKLQRFNIAKNVVSQVVDTARLSGTAHYMFADANVAPVMEVAFLDGNETPYLELQNGFEVDGATWKVRLDFGVAGVDFRGAVLNAGA